MSYQYHALPSTGTGPESWDASFSYPGPPWPDAFSEERVERFHAQGGVIGGTKQSAHSQFVAGAFQSVAVLPIPLCNNHGASSGGKAYMLGGQNAANAEVQSIYEYDPTDTWDSGLTDMPTPGRGDSGVAAGSDGGTERLWTAGGIDNVTVLSDNDAYTPGTDTWGSDTSMGSARFALTGVASGGLGYFMGGHNGTAGVDLNHSYTFATDSWATGLTVLSRICYSHFAAAISGVVYVAFGLPSPAPTQHEAYSISGDSWANKTTTTQRHSGAGAAIKGEFWAAGGNNGAGVIDTVQSYNPTTNAWTSRDSLPAAIQDLHGAALAA